jgi:hypothetical protein
VAAASFSRRRLTQQIPFARDTLEFSSDTILWAWERPEQLDFIDTKRIGVAYLAKTIQLRDDELFVRPRTSTTNPPSEIPELWQWSE